MATKYKIEYFDIRAKAEVSRLLFTAAGVEFEDKRYKFNEWGPIKESFAQKALPVLTFTTPDGKERKVSQSIAIAKYLAKKFGFYPKSNEDQLSVDEILDTCTDLWNRAARAIWAEEDKREGMMKELAEVHAPRILQFLENAVSEYGQDGYAVGNSLTVADCQIFTTIDYARCENQVDKYPFLKKNRDKMKAHAKIGPYLKSRPDSIL